MDLAEISSIVGGALHDADPDTVVTGSVEYDSRRVSAGGLFLALPGERVDGHDYVEQAVRDGAVAALVARPVPGPRIEVADGIAALTALAADVARRLSATIIGVTGSSGKTSTKDLLAALLPALGPTIAPAGSANNELGHPYTVLRADAATRFLVLELGARGIGHIRHLTATAPPRIGVVLNVGSAHLGEFGSREAIAAAKGELVEALPDDGLAVLNADDPLVLGMAARTAARVVTVGRGGEADVRASDVELDGLGRAAFTLHAGGASRRVTLRLVGAHHVDNALAAAAVALEAGLDLTAVAAGLGGAGAASRWRMELTERPDGVVVINDAYNANPESMRAALETLAAVAGPRRDAGGRAMAVLGPMAELGAASARAHEAIGRLAVDLDLAALVAVGDAARPIERSAVVQGSSGSWTGEATWVSEAGAALGALDAIGGGLHRGDVVLVKASRSAGLERVALALASVGAPAADGRAADGRGGTS